MAKRNPTAELAAQALQRLEQLRAENSEYPISLDQLLVGVTSDPAARKAIGKSALFKAGIVRSHAQRGDAPIALRGDEQRLAASQPLFEFACRSSPSGGPPWNAAELAKLVPATLRAPFQDALRQRAAAGLPIALSNDEWIARRLVLALQRHYEAPAALPIRLTALAQRAGFLLERDQAKLKKAAATPHFQRHVLALVDKSLDSPITLADRPAELVRSPDALPTLVAAAQTGKKRLVPIADVLKKAAPGLRPHFSQFLANQLPDGELPGRVVAIQEGPGFKLFLLDDLLPTPLRRRLVDSPTKIAPVSELAFSENPPERHDFASKFDEAFRRLDAQNGNFNQVSLRALRDELSAWSREQFDAELQPLRLSGMFYLSGVQDRGGIAPEEQAAGIREAGLLRVYVSRKS